MRYRCTVRFTDTSTVTSPPFRQPGLCWWYAHGVAEHEGEGINLLRDLEGRAEAGVEGFITGDHATYTVEVDEGLAPKRKGGTGATESSPA